MAIKLKQPMSAGFTATAGGCVQCCWERSADCWDRLHVRILWDGIPRACPFVHASAAFNGGSAVDAAGCCASDPYVVASTAAADGYFHFYIYVWNAFAGGLWTSSTTVVIRTLNNTAIDFGPESDAASTCWQYGFAPLALDGACAGAVAATITILDDGTMSIA